MDKECKGADKPSKGKVRCRRVNLSFAAASLTARRSRSFLPLSSVGCEYARSSTIQCWQPSGFRRQWMWEITQCIKTSGWCCDHIDTAGMRGGGGQQRRGARERDRMRRSGL